MKKVLRIFLVVIVLTNIACTDQEETFFGNWEHIEDGRVLGVFQVMKDSLARFEYIHSRCDTFISHDHTYPIADLTFKKDQLLFDIVVLDKREQLRLELLSDSSGKICADDDCADIKKTSWETTIELSKEEVLLHGWKVEIAMQIDQTENQFKSYNNSFSFSKDAQQLISFIDSARADLLSHYEIQYDSTTCWGSVDSLLAHKYATEILFGDFMPPKNTRFSAVKIRNHLFSFLDKYKQREYVSMCFPFYSIDREPIRDYYGTKVNWEQSKFFRRPLGLIIVELNSIKLNIAKLEALRNSRITSPSR